MAMLCYGHGLTLDRMYIDEKDQLRGRSIFPLVKEYKNILNANNCFKVCTKSQTQKKNKRNKEASRICSFKKAIIQKMTQEYNKRLNERTMNKLCNSLLKKMHRVSQAHLVPEKTWEQRGRRSKNCENNNHSDGCSTGLTKRPQSSTSQSTNAETSLNQCQLKIYQQLLYSWLYFPNF